MFKITSDILLLILSYKISKMRQKFCPTLYNSSKFNFCAIFSSSLLGNQIISDKILQSPKVISNKVSSPIIVYMNDLTAISEPAQQYIFMWAIIANETLSILECSIFHRCCSYFSFKIFLTSFPCK